MSPDRYVVAGLAPVRSSWFTEVSRWATMGALPIEFLKCLSAEELRALLAGGRPLSAVLVDARHPGVDRDLLASIARASAARLVVVEPADVTDWQDLGASVVLGAPVHREELLAALAAHATPIESVPAGGLQAAPPAPTGGWLAPLISVIGSPGAGTSTVSAALAQALADDPARHDQVLLADLARRAHQGVLHDARDVVPGLPDLVEQHRTGRVPVAETRALTFPVPGRGYRLLLGLRHPGQWVAWRAGAVTASLESLRRSFRLVVADVDGDLEGEAETGSFDVEDRNRLARTAVEASDLVVVVGSCTSTGLFDLVRGLADLRRHGVAGARTLVTLNRGPSSGRRRAELTRALAELTSATTAADPHLGPMFLRSRRGIDEVHRDVVRFPASFSGPLAATIGPLLDGGLPAGPRRPGAEPQPRRIEPGSLGHRSEIAS
ncbi:MAG: hypothetical protein JWM89_1623 [Acidimicrobiales bacterium]|nr:hypothetical protein [Acidimicrobiales bacterium]